MVFEAAVLVILSSIELILMYREHDNILQTLKKCLNSQKTVSYSCFAYLSRLIFTCVKVNSKHFHIYFLF